MNRGWFRPYWTLISISILWPHTPVVKAAEPVPAPKKAVPAADPSVNDSFVDNQDLDTEDLDDPNVDTERSGTERITNSYSLQAGVGFRKGPGLELELGWHIDEDRLVEIRIGSYTAQDVESFSTIKLQSLIVQSKMFMNNSLFFSVGAGFTSFDAEGKETLLNNSGVAEDNAYTGTLNQGLLALTAGNQWQIGDWTLGVDWLKFYLPFSVSVDSSRIESTGSSAELRQIKFENEFKTVAWDIDYGFGIYGGYVF